MTPGNQQRPGNQQYFNPPFINPLVAANTLFPVYPLPPQAPPAQPPLAYQPPAYPAPALLPPLLPVNMLVPANQLPANQLPANQLPAPRTAQDRLDLIVNIILQSVSIALAVVFGIWSIKSFETAVKANILSTNSLQEAVMANSMSNTGLLQSWAANVFSLYSYCHVNPDDADFCSNITSAVDPGSLMQTLITLPPKPPQLEDAIPPFVLSLAFVVAFTFGSVFLILMILRGSRIFS